MTKPPVIIIRVLFTLVSWLPVPLIIEQVSPWRRQLTNLVRRTVTAKESTTVNLKIKFMALTEEFRMNQSEYNVKQSITIKLGCITTCNRYLHVITNHYHEFTGHLILNKCVSDLSLKVLVCCM